MSHNWKRYARHLRFALKGADQDIGHLRRGAIMMLAAVSGEDASAWKASSLDASMAVWSEYVRELASAESAARALISRLASARSGDDAFGFADEAEAWLRKYPSEDGLLNARPSETEEGN